MARELKGLGAGLIAGLGVVGAAFGVSAIATHGQASPAHDKPQATAAHPAVLVSQVVTTGHGYFLTSCAACHGKDGRGVIGPNLHNLGDPDAKIALNIKNGYKGQMPPYRDKYNDTQIAALVAYIQSLT
jgi:mono/diheme cytochrome c family protein